MTYESFTSTIFRIEFCIGSERAEVTIEPLVKLVETATLPSKMEIQFLIKIVKVTQPDDIQQHSINAYATITNTEEIRDKAKGMIDRIRDHLDELKERGSGVIYHSTKEVSVFFNKRISKRR